MTEQKFYSVQEVAERYRVHPRTIVRWIESGMLPGSIKKNPMGLNSPFEIPQYAIDHFDSLRNATSEK